MRANSKYSEDARIVGNLLRRERFVLAAVLLFLGCQGRLAWSQSEAGQTAAPETAEQKIEHLTAAVAQAQTQMEAYQKQLLELREQLAELRQQMAAEKTVSPSATQPAAVIAGSGQASTGSAESLEEIRERQAMEE